MTIKIGLTGAQNSGKTTLAEELHKILPDAYRVKSIARECPYPINETTTIDGQLWIMTTRIKTELEAKKDKPHFIICERTVLDDYAYFYRKYEREQLYKETKDIYANLSENMQWSIVANWLKTYDFLFYLEPLPLVADGTRSTDKAFQDEIDSIIYSGLQGFKYTRLEPGEFQDRVKRVMEIIQVSTND